MTRRAVFAFLLAACVGLGVLVFFELSAPAGVPPKDASTIEAAPRSPADAVHQEPPFTMPPLDAFAEVNARPLFSQSRRPAAVAGPNQIGPIDSWLLRGIVIAQGVRAALIEHGRPATLSQVEAGQDVEGWTIVEVQADTVVLENGGVRQELKLFKDASDAGAAAVAPPPAATARRPR